MPNESKERIGAQSQACLFNTMGLTPRKAGRIAALEPDPRQLQSEVNSIVPNEVYSQESS